MLTTNSGLPGCPSFGDSGEQTLNSVRLFGILPALLLIFIPQVGETSKAAYFCLNQEKVHEHYF